MGDMGGIVANDRHPKRLSMLEYNVKHLGITSVVTTCYAGQTFPLRCKFDRVLVDADWNDYTRRQCKATTIMFMPHHSPAVSTGASP